MLYFLALAISNGALSHITCPEDLFKLMVPERQSELELSWTEGFATKAVFRDVENKSWKYFQASNQLRRLGERAGLEPTLTAYCIRRSAANAIHGMSTLSSNLI